MVNVKKTDTNNRISVKSVKESNVFGIKDNLSEYYAKQAEHWAHSEEMVNGIDYSSKYYAEKSKESANKAEIHKNNTLEAINGFDENVQVAKDDIEQKRIDSINAINNTYSVALGDMQEKSNEVLTSIESSKAEAVDSINGTKTTILNDIEFVADGEKKEIEDLADLIKENAEEIANRTSLAMFDTILKDHILTYEESKGLALQGAYVYKNAVAGERYGYPDFYAKCLEEYNEATTTETVNGVTVKVHSNGHKFYDIANKSAIDGFFNTMGSAWFYGVDIAEERIFLPRNNFFEQMTGNSAEVGDSVEAGLPNITATATSSGEGGFSWQGFNVTGAFTKSGTGTYDTAGKGGSCPKTFGFDASKSNSIYGKSNTVQPNAVKKLLYICVGNTVSDTSWVDVVTQVEGGVKDLEDKTLEGIERLKQSSTALTQTQITNCLLEVPQRIKLELNNGVLTLKAGSELTYGDGRTIVIENDIVQTGKVNATLNDLILIHEPGSKGFGVYIQGANATSGATPPTISTGTVNYIWFDTNTNQMKISHNTQATWTEIPLPIGVVDITPNTYTALKQVFNGMGYIGSTVWLDKGVKGLIPNGRNEDGTLNNIERTSDVITIINTTSTNSWLVWSALSGTPYRNAAATTFYYQDEQPVVKSTYCAWYSPRENLFRTTNDKGVTWTQNKFCLVFQYSNENTVVKTFNPKLPFRAVDYNDKSEISGWNMPSDKYINLTLGASGTTYIAPANGYYLLSKYATAQAHNIAMRKFGEIWVLEWAPVAQVNLFCWVPVTKGETISITYSATGTTNYFRFYYAEGEV